MESAWVGLIVVVSDLVALLVLVLFTEMLTDDKLDLLAVGLLLVLDDGDKVFVGEIVITFDDEGVTVWLAEVLCEVEYVEDLV